MDPPPRTSNAEASQQGQSPLISLFDFHLKVLNDSYLSFFQERKRIEEIYVDSLARLHRRATSVDAHLDDRGELSTTRSAWNDVRDNIDREAQTRQAFLATLSVDVIQPLISLKETQDRTRKRILEDLKESSSAYNDYAENALPKLKSRYMKKYQEVEEQKKAAAAGPPITPSATLAPEIYTAPLPNSRSNPSMTRPIVTSPQPLRALDRRPSGSAQPVRNRSPSTSTAFSDLAHQGKKQLNQLIASAKDGLGGRSENALRNVRAKREADEADKEYRKGIHWLETLRLRRTKILEGGYQSLEMFIHECSLTVKKVLERYIDNMAATTTTQTQLSNHAHSSVNKISPEKDASKLASYIPRSLASAIPEPTLYQHGKVGYCRDLIFGISLVDYATARGLQDGQVPKIIRICINEVDKRGLESEGIYRVSGRHAMVHTLQHEFERDENAFEFNSQKDDVYAVSSLLKLYLRELPEPVFKYPLPDRIQHTEDRADHQSNNFKLLRAKMRRLQPVHQATLKAIVEHLSRVISFSEKNKMDAKNLAIVFGGVIFGDDELPKGGDLLSVQTSKDTVMEDLILNAHTLFEDHPVHHSPPLPPTPAGEPVPSFAYGTQHTKVASVPGNIKLIPSEDFTPRLPPRPANSIHPSLRAGSSSPTKDRPIPPSTLAFMSAYDSPLPLTTPSNTEGSIPQTDSASADTDTLLESAPPSPPQTAPSDLSQDGINDLNDSPRPGSPPLCMVMQYYLVSIQCCVLYYRMICPQNELFEKLGVCGA